MAGQARLLVHDVTLSRLELTCHHPNRGIPRPSRDQRATAISGLATDWPPRLGSSIEPWCGISNPVWGERWMRLSQVHADSMGDAYPSRPARQDLGC